MCVLAVYLHPDDTMLTTMDEEVLELCTSTVTRMPITRPATGFASTAFFWKMLPATLPEHMQTHAHTHTGSIIKPIKADIVRFSFFLIIIFITLPTSWKAELRMTSEQTKK